MGAECIWISHVIPTPLSWVSQACRMMGETLIRVQCHVLGVVLVLGRNTWFVRKDNEAVERRKTNALLSTQNASVLLLLMGCKRQFSRCFTFFFLKRHSGGDNCHTKKHSEPPYSNNCISGSCDDWCCRHRCFPFIFQEKQHNFFLNHTQKLHPTLNQIHNDASLSKTLLATVA